MPIYMRLPKRGFNKPNRKRWAELSIANVNRAIEAGKLDAKTNYDAAALVEAGVLRRSKDGVRLIGAGKLFLTKRLFTALKAKKLINQVKRLRQTRKRQRQKLKSL